MKYKVIPRLFNEESDKLIERYVKQFNQFGKKSAEGVIGMGRVVQAAHQNLEDTNEFRKFCNRIRFENGSSSLRKLIQIGQKADLLETYLDQLPSSWTTLYLLSTLTDAQLKEGLTQKRIEATMSGAQVRHVIAELCGNPPTPKRQRSQKSAAIQTQEAILDNVLALTLHFDSPPSPGVVKEIEAAVSEIAEKRRTFVRSVRSKELDALLADDE
jgi:hypothetical protein